jgi:predicted ATPase/DNA-binding CsgD family transcriptional regulator
LLPDRFDVDDSTLPTDLTTFVGRRAELADVKRRLGTRRLVTLTGVGGVGKTRMALRTAHELRRRFADGVVWVELADLRDPALLAQTIEDRIVIPEKIGRDATSILLNHLRHRQMLLVLDNAEHLLDECARVVALLLREAAHLRVLVTSRQGLGVPGERLHPVAPLPVPTADQSLAPGAGVEFASLELFQERAAAIVPDFRVTAENQTAVAEICRKLEGIPLAIELATVKLRALSVVELASRLDGRLEMLASARAVGPSRHHTLQATIDWSFELCTPEERLLWARASVFAGGFTMEAAEECCSDDSLPKFAVLEAVAGLVDKSILSRTDSDGRVRFRLLEPLREHGLAELDRIGEAQAARDRHRTWCCELVHQASLQWFGPAQELWCVTLHHEKANIRAAAEMCLKLGDGGEAALRLLGEPWFLWVALFLDEGQHWLALALATTGPPSPARAWALATAGYVAALQGRGDDAEELLGQSRSMANEVEHAASYAYGTHVLGLSALFNDSERAIQLFLQALPLYEAASSDVGDDVVVGMRVQLGLALLFQGRFDEAGEQFSLCRRKCSVAGERWLLSYALYGEGFISFARGEFEKGIELARGAVEIKRFFGDTLGLAVSLDLLAWLDAEAGKPGEAAVLLGTASRLWDSFGVRLFGSDEWLGMGEAAEEKCRSALGAARFDAAVRDGQALSRDEALSFALGERAALPAIETRGPITLTPREREIADLVAEGLSNRAISERLVIAQRTAECHVENILTKFGFRSRSQIAAWVAEHRAVS